MTLESSVTLVSGEKILYLRTLVHGAVLHQFDMLFDELGSTTSENLKSIILGLVTYFFPVNALSKQKCVMRRGMRNPRGLNIRLYAAHMIGLNKYLSIFPWAKANEKMYETDLNEILLKSMPNRWIRHAYVQWFDCEPITLKSVNMFERTEIE